MSLQPTFYFLAYDRAVNHLPILFSYKIGSGDYGTNIEGGFYSASINLVMPYGYVRHIYRKILGKDGQIVDQLGNTVFEGEIKNLKVDGNVLTINLIGHYSHAKDLIFGMIYPTSTPTSISDVIEDVIDMGVEWDSSKLFVHQTTRDITPLDFSGERKLKDAIDEVLKFGSEDSPPRRMYFQVWENKVCHLVREPNVETNEPDFVAWVKPISGALATTLSTDNIYNKIQVFYDDPNLDGPDFTAWEEDLESQALYGKVEGSYSLGESTLALAELVAEMLMTKYNKPEQSFTLGINNQNGYIRGNGAKPQHLMRAGDIVRLENIDTAVDFAVSNNPGKSLAQAVVFTTRYDMGSNSISITLGTKAATFDFLMTRLGLSVGSMS